MKKSIFMGVFISLSLLANLVAFNLSALADDAPSDPQMPSKILWIGDSHSGMTFGKTIDGLLRSAFGVSQVSLYSSCGTNPLAYKTGAPTTCGYFESLPVFNSSTQAYEVKQKSWSPSKPGLKYPTPLLENLIQSIQPNILIVEHGSNMIVGYEDPGRAKMIQFILDEVTAHSLKCIWVGPPDMRGFKGRPMTHDQISHVSEQIRTLTQGKCEYIDSLQYTQYPADPKVGDGVHYYGTIGDPLARTWATAIASDIGKFLTP